MALDSYVGKLYFCMLACKSLFIVVFVCRCSFPPGFFLYCRPEGRVSDARIFLSLFQLRLLICAPRPQERPHTNTHTHTVPLSLCPTLESSTKAIHPSESFSSIRNTLTSRSIQNLVTQYSNTSQNRGWA